MVNGTKDPADQKTMDRLNRRIGNLTLTQKPKIRGRPGMKLQVIVYNGRVEFVTGFQLLLPVFSCHDFVGRHFRISISRMERDFLSSPLVKLANPLK